MCMPNFTLCMPSFTFCCKWLDFCARMCYSNDTPYKEDTEVREIYEKQTANYPRLATDALIADYENEYRYSGFVDEAIRYIEEFQLLDPVHWRRFVEQFRFDSDFEGGWRGEYWGKMMRGAALTYSYTKNEALYKVLRTTVCDMIESEDALGRISSYAVSHELQHWDLWCRKYVLLGMQYFLEICREDALKLRIVGSMCRQVDYLMDKLGPKEEKKIPITCASGCWRGMNSSSILEPVVRLYSITGEQKYLDFATYIIECGGTSVENVFELALRDELLPYQYPITKAYETTSCFEGALEYYRVTGIEKYKTAVINFANRVLESDFTVIGSAGCTHELFDHSFVRQANTTNNVIQQETCVTVTLMKFFYQLTLLTGDTRYVDAFEISMYNAYFGAINTEKVGNEEYVAKAFPGKRIVSEPLPFDSYSPLTAGIRRGREHVGGFKVMADNHYYGCCACIGSAGNGLIPKMQLMTSSSGFALNLYINGEIVTTTPTGQRITLETVTDYPREGRVEIIVHIPTPERFELKLRNPAWSKDTRVSVNGESVSATDGYISIWREWCDGDRIVLEADMRTEAIYPTPYGTDILMNKVVWGMDYVVPNFDREDPMAKHHIALRRGPVMLAQESRLGYSVDEPISICVGADGYVDVLPNQHPVAPYPTLVEVSVPLTDGSYMTVTDYASAGKLWSDESRMAVWMLTK